jgi:hypothetical protein
MASLVSVPLFGPRSQIDPRESDQGRRDREPLESEVRRARGATIGGRLNDGMETQ